MVKRVRHSQLKGHYNSDDRISKLPDDIVISILSCLPLKEAAITSILSRRWRYVWTNVTALNFGANEALDRIAWDPKLLKVERNKYINWVNLVMRHHRGPTVENFRICFDLDKTSSSAIDKWIKFAVSKGIQTIQLELLESKGRRESSRNYTFRHLRWMEPTSNFGGFKCLKYLSLVCVNVSSKVLAYLISNCPLLEDLSIDGSKDLVDVRITDSSLVLKHLDILFCDGIEKIEIRDTNLLSFTYLGEGIDLVLDNVPMLEEVRIGEGESGIENNVFGQLSCCLSQLHILTLDITRPEGNMELLEFPEFPKLKELRLEVGAWDDDSLLVFTPLIKACPYIERFQLQLFWAAPSKTRREVRKAEKCAHQYLKLVKIFGYYGRVSDFELVMYFIENAPSLQKIVIEPQTQILDRTPVKISEIKREEAARRSAKKQLEAKIPPGVQLEILWSYD